MAKTNIETCIETTKRHVVKLDANMILNALGITMLPVHDLRVYVRVPGGGDWSNTALDIDDECPLIIEWVTKEVETDRSTK